MMVCCVRQIRGISTPINRRRLRLPAVAVAVSAAAMFRLLVAGLARGGDGGGGGGDSKVAATAAAAATTTSGWRRWPWSWQRRLVPPAASRRVRKTTRPGYSQSVSVCPSVPAGCFVCASRQCQRRAHWLGVTGRRVAAPARGSVDTEPRTLSSDGVLEERSGKILWPCRRQRPTPGFCLGCLALGLVHESGDQTPTRRTRRPAG